MGHRWVHVWAARVELHHLPGFHEPFSAISHLVGVVLFAWLGWRLLRRGYRYCRERGERGERGDRADRADRGRRERHLTGRMLVLGLYAFACVLLMAMSAVFHMVERGGAAHRVMERLDHSAIFLLIAGTITPIHGLLFRGRLRWGPLTFLWIATAAAIILKMIFFETLPEWLGLSLYLALGWFGAVAVIALARRHGARYVRPLIVGGAFYTLGAVMDVMGELVLIPGVVHAHEVFHLAVLAGALSHWLFIYDIAGKHAEVDGA